MFSLKIWPQNFQSSKNISKHFISADRNYAINQLNEKKLIYPTFGNKGIDSKIYNE